MLSAHSIEVFRWDARFTREKLLQWALQQSETVLFLAGDDYPNAYPAFEYALALAPQSYLQCKRTEGAFDKLEDYRKRTADWLFGHLSYDLKNELEKLQSENPDSIGFPELFFFQPQKLIFKKGDRLEFHHLDPQALQSDCEAIRNSAHTSATEACRLPPLDFTLE